MTDSTSRDVRLWLLISLAIVALFGGAMLEATRSVNCAQRVNDADCDREAASAFAANVNGAVFDRINLLAGHVAPADQAMALAARYALYAVAGLVGLSWFLRNRADRERRLGVYSSLLSAVVALSAASVIQHVYVHQRPFVLRADVILLVPHGADPSFPSEHTTAAFALATAVAMYRSRVGLILLALASLVGFSRIYVGLHYPADVAVGALLGIAAAFSVWLARRPLAWLDAHVIAPSLPTALR